MEIKPRYFAFALTDRCQSHCITCSGWKTPIEKVFDELSTNDWKFILLSLKKWIGQFDFIFTGGEPFLRDDIYELANFAAGIGLKPKVITNALALQNKCEKLINTGFTDITISLNSVKDPKIHNLSRGRNNAFKITSDVIQNITYLNRKKNAGKTILIASVIMPSNLTELVPLAEFAHINGIGINFQMLDGGESFFAAENIQSERLKMFDEMKNQTVEAIEKLIDLKKQGYLIYNTDKQLLAFMDLISNSEPEVNNNGNNSNQSDLDENISSSFNQSINRAIITDKIIPGNICHKISDEISNSEEEFANNNEACKIGNYNFLIDPYGNVRVCFTFEPIGSLLKSTPECIWNSIEAKNIRKLISNCNKSCKLLNCNYHEEE